MRIHFLVTTKNLKMSSAKKILTETVWMSSAKTLIYDEV